MFVPVILSGGSGSRLWPVSRKNHPKQFIPIENKSTLLENIIEHINNIENSDDFIIIGNE